MTTAVPARRLLVATLIAVLLLGIGGLVGGRATVHPAAVPTVHSGPSDPIVAVQRHLTELPGDWVSWAALGSAYVERARITADASWYPKAEGALRESLRLRPDGNPGALVGLGALAAARHDFTAARDFAQRALRTDPYDADAYGVLADAQTQLGRPAAATDAVQHELDLHPGLASYARASYDLEQRGRLAEAQTLMRQALDASVDPADIAFCRYQLGELAWQSGRLADAAASYDAGLAADPAYLPLREGRAKVAAARGSVDAALTDYADVTARYPSPGYLLEYAELLRASGRETEAQSQLQLAAAAQRLFTAGGGTDDLNGALLALAQGQPAVAVAAARREWQRRQHADVADTLGWALHAAGRDAEARGYATLALATGAHNARYAYHLGLIQLALGHRSAARAALTEAVTWNPYFSPLDGPVAARTLASLGGAA